MFGNDEHYYATVVQEIQQGNLRPGLWAKALAGTGYDENKAKAKYIKFRVQSMKEEANEQARIQRQAQRLEKSYVEQSDRKNQLNNLHSYQHTLYHDESRLEPLRRQRQQVFSFLIILGCVIGYLLLAGTEMVASTVLLGGLGGLIVAQICCWIMPGQRRLDRERKRIKSERQNVALAIDKLQKTTGQRVAEGLGQLVKVVILIVIGVFYLIYKANH